MQISPDQDCNVIATALDGQAVKIKASRLWNLGIINFQGWMCSAGMTCIFVDHDLTVYGGQCRQSPLGNLNDMDFALNRRPIRCERATCTPCESDLYVAKWRVSD